MQTYDYIISPGSLTFGILPPLSLPPPVLKGVGKRYFAISVRNSCDCVHCVARANAVAKERADKNQEKNKNKSIFELIAPSPSPFGRAANEKTPGYGKDNLPGSATNWS